MNEAGPDELLGALREAELRLEGRLPWSSNATFLVSYKWGGGSALAVYKPAAGVRPLWDFSPGTLHRRELAAYVVSRALGWDQVPASLIREGPLGPGLIQHFVAHDPDRHLLVLEDPDPAWLQRLAAFDAIINNADRKSGHVLEDGSGRLWAIDHGLTFHTDPKLRTVLWDYAGQALPSDVTSGLAALRDVLQHGALRAQLAELIAADEIDAFAARIRDLERANVFPEVPLDRPEIPWPPV